MPYVGGSVASFFNEAARQLTRNAARDMTDAGVRHWQRITTMNTPVRTGRLRSSWKTTRALPGFQDAGDRGYRADVETDVDYAPYVEYGTGLWGPKHAPYVIRPKKPGGMLRWVGKDGRVIYARYVVHPGSPGNHMLAIGANVTEAAAQEGTIFADVLERWVRGIEAQASKEG